MISTVSSPGLIMSRLRKSAGFEKPPLKNISGVYWSWLETDGLPYGAAVDIFFDGSKLFKGLTPSRSPADAFKSVENNTGL